MLEFYHNKFYVGNVDMEFIRYFALFYIAYTCIYFKIFKGKFCLCLAIKSDFQSSLYNIYVLKYIFYRC
jgi:hypothetical protein